MPDPGDVVRVAAVADLHYTKASAGAYRDLFRQMGEAADVLLLCGDLTDYGLPEEAEHLVQDLQEARNAHVISILGNHDFESNREHEITEVLTQAGVVVLDGGTCEFKGLGFAGTRGFGGGFGRGSLGFWGEPVTKAFVQEAIDESLKLERALGHLATSLRIALLHYSPIPGTLEGEPREIFPYLGSSRLEEPLNRLPLTAVFHGHAHGGVAEGKTSNGVPVYNVSLPVLKRLQPESPFRLLKFTVAETHESPQAFSH